MNVYVVPEHITEEPLMAGVGGSGLIVTSRVATAVLHVPVTVYFIVSVPAVTPVTTPPVTVALLLEALHVPVVDVSVKVTVAPGHIVDAPLIAPTLTDIPIVIAWVSAADPQLLVTV